MQSLRRFMYQIIILRRIQPRNRSSMANVCIADADPTICQFTHQPKYILYWSPYGCCGASLAPAQEAFMRNTAVVVMFRPIPTLLTPPWTGASCAGRVCEAADRSITLRWSGGAGSFPCLRSTHWAKEMQKTKEAK